MRPRIVLFGDSITQRGFELEHRGWAAGLANAYSRKSDIINRGYSGYNTRWASQLVDSVASEFDRGQGAGGARKGDILTIFFGANDAALASTESGANQHVPISEYSENLAAMVDKFRDLLGPSPPPIVLISPPPVDERAWAGFMGEPTSNRTLESSKKYAEACRQVSAAKGAAFVDTWSAIYGGGHLSECFMDGLHLSSKGNDIVLEALAKTIAESSELAGPEDVPMDAPIWQDIDQQDIEGSIAAYTKRAK